MTTASLQRKFQTCTEHYVRGRLNYPIELIRKVADATGIGSGDRILDLGCGPGFLAVAFKPFVREVIGIDPEPQMLDQARALAHRQAQDISFREGSSFTLGPDLGAFRLVTMGRSFHWMDRKQTLQMLDRLVLPEGALVLFSDKHPAVPENHWREGYESVLGEFGGPRRHRDPSWIPNDVFLRESRFCELETLSVTHQLLTPVESIVDRALSMSVTTPERLGGRIDEFTQRVKAVLEPIAQAGKVMELVEWRALVARGKSLNGAHVSTPPCS